MINEYAAAEKPGDLQLELGPAGETYEGRENPMPVAPPPAPPPPQPLAVITNNTPDLKEPDPEQPIEYNAALEYKKALIASSTVFSIIFVGLILVFMQKGSYDSPTCPEDDWYKLNDIDSPRNCEPCGQGTIVLPLGGELEKAGSLPLRAIIYLLGLGWCFLGIAIVCDQFMAAIEEITSKQKVVWLKVHGDTKHKFHKKIWNDTVANLTLMALGSSAPEILLSVIELVGNSFFAGELGPSTIVGSAAFNLLVITAVCVSAIPAPEIRKIDGLAVFAVTASLSIFAYVWLIIILQLSSADVVTIPEAVVTFLFFPRLVITAFCADKGYFGRLSTKNVQSDSNIYDEQARLEKLYSKKISFETVKMMVEDNGMPKAPQMTKAQYRRAVMKNLIGGKKEEGLAEVSIGFVQPKYITLECAGQLDVPVKLSARVEGRVDVRYFTQDGLAAAGKRYTYTEGTFTFQPGETEKLISVPIIDNEVWEEQEDFSIYLDALTKDGEQPGNAIGYNIRSTKVIILNDDEPGTLCFFVDEVQASREASSVQVGISRINGSTGRISCRFETQDGTAVAGSNYSSASGELIFEEGVCRASIEIGIAPLGTGRKSDIDRSFNIILNNPSEGVKFDVERDGGREMALCEIILPGAPSKRGAIKKLLQCCMCDMKVKSSMPDWKGQFVSAFYCNGSAADQSTSSKTDWIFHCFSIFWKFIFAFVPPAQIAGGWACFCCALGMIGMVTMIVGDMASLMGCCIGIPDDITAITIVALGTSLPDTFASKSAAQHDPNADNSIGNVTGSNCVNVFLGLGLPWTFGALYWDGEGKSEAWIKKDFKGLNYEEEWGSKCPEGCFLVPAGSLSFSVTIFTITAVTCVALLMYRRAAYGGELGGPAFASKRDAGIMVFLWFVYVIMSILKSLGAL
jgi:solute carrier family 8 (sodium/calcium exchanger)